MNVNDNNIIINYNTINYFIISFFFYYELFFCCGVIIIDIITYFL